MEKMNLNDEYGILLERVNHPMPLYSNLYSINTNVLKSVRRTKAFSILKSVVKKA